MAKPTRWGFMGCGKIASDFATAMKTLPREEHEVVAVSAGDLNRAREFANKFGAKHSFEGYVNLAACPDVDIVYVNPIHPMHFQAVKLALNGGKAVLCEKPMGMNLREVKEMNQLAREKGLFLMEGFWSRCFPLYDEIRQALREGKIGEPRTVEVNFGFEGHADRLLKKELGGGALLDIGCYMIMFSTMIFNQRPQEIRASATLNEEGVDVADRIILEYPNDSSAQLTCSFQTNMNNSAIVSGTKGKLELPDHFSAPTNLVINSDTLTKPLPDCNDKYNFPHSAGLAYEAHHVRQCLLEGLTESPLMPLEESELIASVMDEIRKQTGVTYPADTE